MTDRTRKALNLIGLWLFAVLVFSAMILIYAVDAHSQTCTGKTAKEQCACLGMDYDAHLKPVPGCVIGVQGSHIKE